MLLRSLQQAQYRPDNVGHFGLSYEAYAHFTSPIRRYPDLLVHRAIKAVLAKTPVQAAAARAGPSSAIHCSLTERRADEATRDVENWLKCYFMQDKVGETFGGTISGVTSFGIFVTLDELNIDGLVHVTELGRDYFHFDAGRHAHDRRAQRPRVPARGPACASRSRASTSRRRRSTSCWPTSSPADPPLTRPTYSEPLSRQDKAGRKPKSRR